MANPKLTVSSEFLSHYKAASIMPADAGFTALQMADSDATEGLAGHALLFSVGSDGVGYLTQESPGPNAVGWTPADLKAGWRKIDLSSALKPSGVTGAKQIAVAQRIPIPTSSGTADPNSQTGTADPNSQNPNIHMALVATTSGDDLLHLSLNNSASDASLSWLGQLKAAANNPASSNNSSSSWRGAPTWQPHPFDGGDRPFGSQVKIRNVFISEASDGEYIVVDLLNQTNNTICRYFIDHDQSLGTGQVWNQHPVPDLDPSTASSVHGRRTDKSLFDGVDGIYTMGSTGGRPQLQYKPLYDPTISADPTDPSSSPFAPGNQPPPTDLALPNQATPTAITAVRRSDGFTDLYVASGNTIYLFTAENQNKGSQAVVAFSNSIVTGVQQLYGYRNDKGVVLWGKSAGADNANPVFYATFTDADGTWSISPPLLTGVHRISPFANKANNANHFFAHTGDDTLRRAMQSPHTSGWSHNDIRLPPEIDPKTGKPKPATRTPSFTTRVQVNDDKGRPMANTAVQISALHRVGVDINGFYLVLDTTPASVKTDATGALNIIEPVKTPRGTPLKIIHPDGTAASANPMTSVIQIKQPDGTTTTTNPATGMIQRATTRVTPDNPTGDLTKITVPNKDGTFQTKQPDGTVTPNKPLIPPGASSGDVGAAAAAMNQLATIHAGLPADGSVHPAMAAAMARVGGKIAVGQVHALTVGSASQFRANVSLGGVVDSIGGAFGDVDSFIGGLAGDVYSALESATNYSVGLFEDTATGLWHFAANIAGQTYHFVLDCAEKVAGAVVAIYKAIKAFIEDLIAWLEFLLEWHDFVRTKDVCKAILLMGLNYVEGYADKLKSEVLGLIDKVKSDTGSLSKIAGNSGVTGSATGASDLNINPPSWLSTIVDYGAAVAGPAMYFYNHFMEGIGGGDSGGASDSTIEKLGANLSETTVNTIVSEFPDVISKLASGNLPDVLKDLNGIVVKAFEQDADDVFGAAFDLLGALTTADMIKSLDQNIRIPVISDIIEDVFRSSLSFSVLDFVLMCGAIPGTLLWKSMDGSMPFHSDDPFTVAILNSNNDLETFLKNYKPQASPTAARAAFAVRALDAGNGQGNSGNGQDNSGNAGDTDLPQQAVSGRPNKAVFVSCHCVAALGQSISAVMTATKTKQPTVTAVCALAAGLSLAASGMFGGLYPIQNTVFLWMNRTVGMATFALKATCYFVDPQSDTAKKAAASMDLVIVLAQLLCSGWHFYELNGEPDSEDRTAVIVDEVATIFGCLSRVGLDIYDVNANGEILIPAAAALLMQILLEFSAADMVGTS